MPDTKFKLLLCCCWTNAQAPSVASVPSLKVECRNMTVEELRDRLGVTDSQIAIDWDREDLAGKLEALEQVLE